VIARDHNICWICGQLGADSADHIIRARDGGPDELWNLRAAHARCNKLRG
jgi:5-methylcytosine-specific restriction endonuclease McrA